MATYIQIDESYSIHAHSGLESVVAFCRDNDFYSRDGKVVSLYKARKDLASDDLRVYSYTDDELDEARENGSASGVDFSYKFCAFKAPYAQIADDYSLYPFASQESIVQECRSNKFYTRNGQEITVAILREALKEDGLRVYSYEDEDDLQEARDNGSVIGIDWKYKFCTV